MAQEPRRELIRWEAMSGDPVTVGGTTVTPHARALVVRLPFGGLVWAFPVSLTVETNGTRRVMPVVDVTRIAQWALLLATILITLMALAGGFSGRRGRHG